MTQRSAAAILAVDDMPSNLLALSALLQPLGYEVVTASSGLEALAIKTPIGEIREARSRY